MKENFAFKIVYTGNHTGKFYGDNIIGIAKTNDEAGKLLNEIIKEDLEIYSDLFKNKKVIVEYNGIQIEVSTSEKDLSNLIPAYPVSSYKLTDGTFEMKYQIKELQYYTLG